MRTVMLVTWQGWRRAGGEMNSLYWQQIESQAPPTPTSFSNTSLLFLFTLLLTRLVSRCLPNAQFRDVFSAPSNLRDRASRGKEEESETEEGMLIVMGWGLVEWGWKKMGWAFFKIYASALVLSITRHTLWHVPLQTQNSGNILIYTLHHMQACRAWKRKRMKM